MKEIQEDTKVALVEQTEKITKIDKNVTQVEEDVTLAHAEIVSAEKHQKGTGKCIYWVVGIVLLVVAGIVTIVLIT